MSNTISKIAITFGRFVKVISVLLLASVAFAEGGQSNHGELQQWRLVE
jgi:hypothetical protein